MKIKSSLDTVKLLGVYGSDKIFSDPDEKFINEDFEPNPQNEYEKTKFDADKILINLGKKI